MSEPLLIVRIIFYGLMLFVPVGKDGSQDKGGSEFQVLLLNESEVAAKHVGELIYESCDNPEQEECRLVGRPLGNHGARSVSFSWKDGIRSVSCSGHENIDCSSLVTSCLGKVCRNDGLRNGTSPPGRDKQFPATQKEAEDFDWVASLSEAYNISMQVKKDCLREGNVGQASGSGCEEVGTRIHLEEGRIRTCRLVELKRRTRPAGCISEIAQVNISGADGDWTTRRAVASVVELQETRALGKGNHRSRFVVNLGDGDTIDLIGRKCGENRCVDILIENVPQGRESSGDPCPPRNVRASHFRYMWNVFSNSPHRNVPVVQYGVKFPEASEVSPDCDLDILRRWKFPMESVPVSELIYSRGPALFRGENVLLFPQDREICPIGTP